MLKSQQRFKSEWYNVFTEEIDNTALRSNGDKRIQSTNLIETYAYGMNKDPVSGKEKIKCNNIVKR